MMLGIPIGIPLPIFIIRVVSPALLFLTALSLLRLRSRPPPPSPITSVVVANVVPRRASILSLLSLVSVSYFLDGAAFVTFVVLDKFWPRYTGIEINAVVGVAGFAGLAALGAWKDVNGIAVWTLRRLKAAVALALALDAALVVLLGLKIRSIRNDIPPHAPSQVSIQELLHFAFPAFRVLLLIPLLASISTPRVVYTSVDTGENTAQASDTTFLLPPGSTAHPTSGGSVSSPEGRKYGTFNDSRSNLQYSAPATRATTPAPSIAPDKPPVKPPAEPNWSEIWRRFKRITPYLWPSKSRFLQLLASLCIIILLVERVITVAVPLMLGSLVDILEGRSVTSPWPVLFGYVGLRFLQGSGGLAAVRDSLWAPVMQYSDREMSQLSFDHLLNLSFAWHTHRKTGEILRVLDRGAAINHTLELVLFNILPTFIDISVALVFFCVVFDWQLAAVIFFVMMTYIIASILLTRYRTKVRREMNEKDMVTRGIHTDCLLNYETVKYFSGEEHEGARYREAVAQYQTLEFKVIMSLNLLNLVQNFIITLGLLIGSMMVAYRITQNADAGSKDFVMFITYITQLYGPLNQLGYIYRSMNTSLVDTERLLSLLSQATEINDKPDAPDLVITDGEIVFDNVNFAYDNSNTALKGMTFQVPKGSSVALVGESGAGKSTILRLLYRFYDLGEGEGRILIDGQDIRNVTQKSLRQAIGVVPQDPILFNSTIGYNIGYGKFGATPEEIEEATRSAQMHDRIMSFPDGYNTKVGERGVRLSGGEKQRVAIARTLLKNPPILLLDEATSALDTSTEKDIQKALQNLVQGRSSLSIAHRLSTVANADLIIVLRDGQIAEQGTFKELLALDGLFASMWADQVSAAEPDPSVAGSSIRKGISSDHPEPTIDTEGETLPDALDTAEEIRLVSTPEQLSTLDLPPTEIVENNDAVDTIPQPVAFPSSPDPDDERNNIESEMPVAFPQSDPPTEPVTFPSSPPEPSKPTGVTFGADVNPSRSETPDLESEPKRKRISSQNFQRLARRISLTTKRQSSSMIPNIPIPGLKRDSSPRVSVDDPRGEGSARGTDSPSGSVKDGKKKDKKDKKDKTRKSTLQ